MTLQWARTEDGGSSLTEILISVKSTLMNSDVSVHLTHAPPIRRVPLALARRFFQICNTVSAEAVAEADLTPLEFAVMAYVNSSDGEPGIDQRGVAERVGVDRNTTSLLVRSLEAKGAARTAGQRNGPPGPAHPPHPPRREAVSQAASRGSRRPGADPRVLGTWRTRTPSRLAPASHRGIPAPSPARSRTPETQLEQSGHKQRTPRLNQ